MSTIADPALPIEARLQILSTELGRLAPESNNKLRAHAAKLIHQIKTARGNPSPGLLDEADEVLGRISAKLAPQEA